MNAIGIIVNPASGKDIRRLVSYGSSFDNTEKINIVKRILMGARTSGVRRIYYMPEYFNIVEAAIAGIFSEHKEFISEMEILRIDMPMQGTETDTITAAEKMRELKVKCVVVLGGDGTCRAAAKKIGEIPMLPMSTGTNNVYPEMIEGTIVGMAAGAYANETINKLDGLVMKSKRLDIYKNDEFFDIALIDVVVLDEIHMGSKAVWKTDNISQIILTCCSASYIGISSIGGQLSEVQKNEPRGLSIDIDPQSGKLLAPLAPGLFVPVGVKDFKVIDIKEKVKVNHTPCIIALDGERNIELYKGEEAYIELTWNGPTLLNVHNILHEARTRRLFFM